MSEALAPFTKCKEEVTFYSRSLKFVTVELRFTNAYTVYAVSIIPLTTGKLVF